MRYLLVSDIHFHQNNQNVETCYCSNLKITPEKCLNGPSLLNYLTLSHFGAVKFLMLQFSSLLFLNWSKDGGHILDGSLATYQALLYTKQNLRLMTLTTLKGFRISPSSEEIRGMSK